MSSAIRYIGLSPQAVPRGKDVSFPEAVFNPATHFGSGLYMPETIAPVDLNDLGNTYQKICVNTLGPYISEDEISDRDLRAIASRLNFWPVITQIAENVFCNDLAFLSPMKAFKCHGAFFNCEIIDYLSGRKGMVATSFASSTGDTGGSVQNQAKGKPHLRSIVAYPGDRVSGYQQAQMDLAGDNLMSFYLEGTDFRGCTGVISRALADEDLNHLNPVASNSKSAPRWLAQMAYNFLPLKHIADNTDFNKVQFFVQTGNAGNIAATFAAQEAIRKSGVSSNGVEITKAHVVSNENDIIPRLYKTGIYAPLEIARQTYSSAMDVADPSNIVRILNMYGLQLASDGRVYDGTGLGWQALHRDSSAQAITDKETKEIMQRWYSEKNIVLDPHTAVAARGMEKTMAMGTDPDTAYVFVKTAEPVKFWELIKEILGEDAIKRPEISWARHEPVRIKYTTPDRTYLEFKEAVLNRFSL